MDSRQVPQLRHRHSVGVFDQYSVYLATGIINIINILDPDVVVLGGGVSAAGEFLLNAVRAKLPPRLFYKTMPYCRVEIAQLGNDAGIIGAAMLGK
jgi:glucokinase